MLAAQVVAERLLRELTREHVLFLAQLQAHDPPIPGVCAHPLHRACGAHPTPTLLSCLMALSLEAQQLCSCEMICYARSPDVCCTGATGASEGPSLLEGLLRADADAAWAAIATAAAALTWPDESILRACGLCK